MTSRLYANSERVWREMYAQAVPVGQLAGRDRYLAGMVPVSALGIYIGPLTKLCQGVGLRSAQQYHHCKGALIQMGCVAQLRRGAAFVQSAWVLLARPSEELFCARVGPIGHPARDHAQRDQHRRDLAEFLVRPPKELAALTRAAGVRDGAELLEFLAALPLRRQRELAIPCLGDAVVGARHRCRWSPEMGEQVHATPAQVS
jgi:hypothetical protein